MKHIRTHFLIFSFVCSFYVLRAQDYNPIADSKAVLQSGNARFTVLTDHVIRLEYSKDKTFTDQASLTIVNRNLPVPNFSTEKSKASITVFPVTAMLCSATFSFRRFRRDVAVGAK